MDNNLILTEEDIQKIINQNKNLQNTEYTSTVPDTVQIERDTTEKSTIGSLFILQLISLLILIIIFFFTIKYLLKKIFPRKKCPYCYSKIHLKATVCKFCQREV